MFSIFGWIFVADALFMLLIFHLAKGIFALFFFGNSRKEIDGILADGVLVSHTEGRIIEARVSHRKSS